MGNDLARSNILYPFTPDSSVHRAMLAGLNDMFMVIPSAGASGSPLPFRDYFAFLYSVTLGVTDVVYLFKASFPGGIQDISFTVLKGNGVGRVNTDHPSIHAVLIVDSDNTYDGTFGEHLLGDTPYAELEPTTIVWRTDTLTSINFINAYRNWDPADRDPDGLPWSNVLTVTGGPLKFKSGYNVSLQYDKSIQTLYVRGIPGAGLGLPAIIPWDSGPPAGAENNIKDINGLSGNATLSGSDKVTVTQTDTNEITLEIEDE